jgi:hypothetical protein
MSDERKEPITVNFSVEQIAELRQLAADDERSLSQMIRHLVVAGIRAEYTDEEEKA